MPIVFIDSPGGTYWKKWQQYVHDELLMRGLVGDADLRLYLITDDIDRAVQEVRTFYSNYHSIRHTRDELVMRLHHAPTADQLAEIQREFSDLCDGGKFRVSAALPVERDEPALANLPRLVFRFHRRDHGRLRILIDFLNSLHPPEPLKA
jgi:hypothetical protein